MWDTARTKLQTAEESERQVVAMLESGRTAHHKRKALAQEAARSKKELGDARVAYRQLDLLWNDLRRILEDNADISDCPVCGTPADPTLDLRRDANFYEFSCSDCGAQWGVRTCRCGVRVPFLGTGSTASAQDRGPGWIDRDVGRDVLAVPQGENAFECSACGNVV
jgi:hypothetical protein